MNLYKVYEFKKLIDLRSYVDCENLYRLTYEI